MSDISKLLQAWTNVDARPDPSNLRGLLQALNRLEENRWDGELQSEIQSGAQQLSLAFERAITETETDMARLPDYSPLMEYYELTLSSYNLALSVVTSITESPDALEGEEIGATIEDVEEALEEMEEDKKQWSSWLRSPQPRCAKCGFVDNAEELCPHCHVDLLIPDNREARSRFTDKAVLGPEYVQAYNCYLSLQDGEASLQQFHQALGPLQQTVRKWNMLIRHAGLESLNPELANRLAACLESSSQGLQLISEAQESRLWSHINDGWDTVFKSAVELQRLLPGLHRALGNEEQARALEQSFRTRDTI